MLTGHVMRDHVLIGLGVAGLLCWPAGWSPLQCGVFWLTNILVDLDHNLNLFYWSRFRAISFARTFRFYSYIHENKRRAPYLSLEIFHTAEFVAAAGVLAFALGGPLPRAAFWGLIFHLMLDAVHMSRIGATKDRAFSLIEYLWRERALRARGQTQTRIHREAGEAALGAINGVRLD